MQIVSMHKNKYNYEDSNENLKTVSNRRSRDVVKFGSSKARRRITNTSLLHRLDHTYAANKKVSKEKVGLIVKDDYESSLEAWYDLVAEEETRSEERVGDDTGQRSSKLRNCRLEYQSLTRKDDCSRKLVSMALGEINDMLKQYGNSQAEVSTPFSIKSTNYLEQNRRLIAALALLELAQSK